MIPLALKCPACGRALAKVQGMRFGTVHANRKCQGCRTQWWIKAEALPVREGSAIKAAHAVEFRDLGLK